MNVHSPLGKFKSMTSRTATDIENPITDLKAEGRHNEINLLASSSSKRVPQISPTEVSRYRLEPVISGHGTS
jgi:hypothetical protein